jgi:hypothetical protein
MLHGKSVTPQDLLVFRICREIPCLDMTSENTVLPTAEEVGILSVELGS